jgi:hypothetical protein
MLKGYTFKKLHDDEGTTILLADVMNGTDVGVIERGCGAGFAAKTFEYLTVPGQVFGKKLERNKAAQARVLRPVNHAHSTAAKLLHNAVVRESRVNHVAAAWIRWLTDGKSETAGKSIHLPLAACPSLIVRGGAKANSRALICGGVPLVRRHMIDHVWSNRSQSVAVQ